MHHHQHCDFTEEFVTFLYEKYTYVLEVHAKVEFSVLYKLSIEYRETTVKVFGASAAIETFRRVFPLAHDECKYLLGCLITSYH